MTEETSKPRRYSRAKLPKGIQIGWQSGTLRQTSRAQTLGLGGLFIETNHPPETGAIVQLVFDTPDGEVRARAAVRSVEPDRGMGVEFVGMDPSGRARLNNLLKRLLR